LSEAGVDAGLQVGEMLCNVMRFGVSLQSSTIYEEATLTELVCTWSSLQEDVMLPETDVHIWYASLKCSLAREESLLDTLAADERARASRFRFNRDRSRFVIGRGLLRAILGKYLRIAPMNISFAYGVNGKPTLAAPVCDLYFNMAHTQEVVLYAVARGHDVGVDIEYIHPLPTIQRVASLVLSLREYTCWQALPEHRRQDAFFSYWTHKEAFVKGLGDGLARPLSDVDVTVPSKEGSQALHIDGDVSESADWSIYNLESPAGYAAALAVRGKVDRCFCRWWLHN